MKINKIRRIELGYRPFPGSGPDTKTLPIKSNAWRKGWDSNPRCPCRHAGFQDRCLKPLGHPSVLGVEALSKVRPSGKEAIATFGYLVMERPWSDLPLSRAFAVRPVQPGDHREALCRNPVRRPNPVSASLENALRPLTPAESAVPAASRPGAAPCGPRADAGG